MRLGKGPLAVVDAHVAVHIQEAHRRSPTCNAALGEGAAELGGAASSSEAGQLAPQRFDLGSAIETQ